LIDIYSRQLPTNKILKDLKTFWRRFWRYSQAHVGFDRVNHSKSIFITTENHHTGEKFIFILFYLTANDGRPEPGVPSAGTSCDIIIVKR